MGRLGRHPAESGGMMDTATAAQVDAADPLQSTWLSANAGSGKTRVLTNRVARLLLKGTNPRNILCLTYTKAAASEMQNRLFATLGNWAMLEDGALRQELRNLGEAPPDDLSEARTLFARAIETPGGLRIQTIHSLCSAVLRQFPLEGEVSPRFREMDDALQIRMIGEVLDEIAETDPAALVDVARFHADNSLVSLAQDVSREEDAFGAVQDPDAPFDIFGVPPGLTCDEILEDALGEAEMTFLAKFPSAFPGTLGRMDMELSRTLAGLPQSPSMEALETLSGALLFGPSAKSPFAAKVGALPAKRIRESESVGPMMPKFNEIMERVETARARLVSLGAAAKTAALHRFARQFLPAYRDAKQSHGVLDFDDLVRRARDVLSSDSLPWVLFRLDGQIEHVLVDEAQDTSPEQWQIVRVLAEAMADDPDRGRTLFVVGDKKQSIYSFQGADAAGFDRKEAEFDRQLRGQLRSRDLLCSFRSSPAILQVVDRVCKGLGGLGGTVARHEAFHGNLPGRVDLLLPVPRPRATEEPPWHHPVDRPVDNAPDIVLGTEIAKLVRGLIDRESIQGDDGEFRQVRPGDIMILVQRRSLLFEQVIQACKSESVPIAGADRLKLGAELAVRDLLALLAFLTLSEDDLSLASALRSPLLGLSEQDLYRLASSRPAGRSLWAELRSRDDEFPDVVSTLDDLRRSVDFMPPYELLEHVLGRHEGRRRLLARLGPEAEDGIDELLNQSLAFEQDNVPSVTGFLTRALHGDKEVKRRPEGTEGLVRVMTVHGAKGLESPVVILPDTMASGRARSGGIVSGPDGFPLPSLPDDECPELLRDAKARRRAEDLEERNRLLYVAMTRAKQWLIVGGIERAGKSDTPLNWHKSVESALQSLGAASCDSPAGVLRLQHGAWPEPGSIADASRAVDDMELPGFLGEVAPEAWRPVAPASPSRLGGAKVLGGDAFDEGRALRRGRQIHLLLEHLPGKLSPEAAAGRLLAHGPDRAGADEIDGLVKQVLANLERHPRIFGADALAEVDVSAHLPTLDHVISGTIDRLLLRPGRVLAVDFKTNAVVPERPEDTPEGLLRQMGAYLEALEHVYPDREIDVAILWTETCRLDPLPHAIVREALARSAIS